ncbi:hypothetical protein COLO4_29945 [Corchorus olitorius]|uniref:Uncharacterized protein n=1 Tax=Corchorus olitorius TaxID=93759 RepID=A0A1R3HCF4_9ROSI|nr:hypothetical protein COLO4_29945 [Corchorus olitorius]
MKQLADKHRTDRNVAVEARSLALPAGYTVHPALHVSKLKELIGSAPSQATRLFWSLDSHGTNGTIASELTTVLEMRMVDEGRIRVERIASEILMLLVKEMAELAELAVEGTWLIWPSSKLL